MSFAKKNNHNQFVKVWVLPSDSVAEAETGLEKVHFLLILDAWFGINGANAYFGDDGTKELDIVCGHLQLSH